jgi:O-methyltransferase
MTSMTASARDVRSRYLELMRRNLTRYGMHEQIPEQWPLRRRLLFKTMNHIIVRGHSNRLAGDAPDARPNPIAQRKRDLGLDWPAEAETMIGMTRLTSLQKCVETVIADEIPGDLIECGVWRGGACILMRAVLAAYGDDSRTVWVADSFEGLPRPDAENYKADKWLRADLFSSILGVPESDVRANFERYGLLDDQVRFLHGWFKDTLPDAPIEQLAILRLDGDLYESTIQALDALYPRLAPGGFCIIDDYEIAACRQAVTDYRTKHGITADIIDIDGTGSLWRK